MSTIKHSCVDPEELLEYFTIDADNFLVMGKFSKRRGQQSPKESKLLPIIRTMVHSLQSSKGRVTVLRTKYKNR